jgi:hypothetical protein
VVPKGVEDMMLETGSKGAEEAATAQRGVRGVVVVVVVTRKSAQAAAVGWGFSAASLKFVQLRLPSFLVDVCIYKHSNKAGGPTGIGYGSI